MNKKIVLFYFVFLNFSLNAEAIFEKAYVSIADLQENKYFDCQLRSVVKNIEYNNSGKYINQSNSENFLSTYDIIVLGTHDKLRACLSKKIKTKIIATLSIATEHLNEIKENHPEVSIVNSPTGNSVSTAEHTFALILALSKKLQERNLIDRKTSGLKGEDLKTTELAGKTLGLVGFGTVAKEVYKRAKAFEMKIIVHTAHPEKYTAYKDVEFMSLEDVIKKSDILSLHIPLNDQTRNIIDAKILNICKPGMILINACRQGLINHDGFKDLLEAGILGGLGLDYDDPDYDFKYLKNVYITPHIAGVTKESKIKMGNELVENIETAIFANQNNHIW